MTNNVVYGLPIGFMDKRYAQLGSISASATYASTALFSTESGSASYATQSGTAQFSTISGTASFATTAGTAAYTASTGSSTYASYLGGLPASAYVPYVGATRNVDLGSTNTLLASAVSVLLVTTSTASSSLTLRQTGDVLGPTSLQLLNRQGSNGAVFTNEGLDLVDFGFVSSTLSQNNLRFEHRAGSVRDSSNVTYGEFQMLRGTSPYPIFGFFGEGACGFLGSVISTGGFVSGSFTSVGTEVTLRESGDSLGATNLKLRNRSGYNGAFITNEALDLCDIGLITNTAAQGSLRFEHRSAFLRSTSNASGEFQLFFSANPSVAWFGGVTNGVSGEFSTSKLKLTQASSAVYTTFSISASTTSVDYTLPTTAGSPGHALTTNGSGTLTWVSVVDSYGLPSVITLSASATLGATGPSNSLVLADTTSGGFTVTLPTAIGNSGRVYSIKKTSSDGHTVTVSGSQTIDGATSRGINSQWVCITVQSNGSEWYIL